MPKLLFARLPKDDREAEQIRKLAQSRKAPGNWIQRARMIVRSWDGARTSTIATELGCHPQTVRERLVRFNAEGLDGFTDRPGAGRKPRLTEAERSSIIGLVRQTPPRKLQRQPDGTIEADQPEQASLWSLDALVTAAQVRGIAIQRSQLRRILLKEGIRRRQVRSWATSTDPEFDPKEQWSSRSTRRLQPMLR